jgi:hypothetical protein
MATWAATEFNSGNLRYKWDSPYLTVIGYSTEVQKNSITSLVIPAYVSHSSMPRGAQRVSSVSGLGGNPSLKSVRIVYGVSEISAQAFAVSEKLEKIFIPSSVSSIGQNAFGDCPKLKEVYCAGETAPSGSPAFLGMTLNYTVYVPYAANSNSYRNSSVFSGSRTVTPSNLPYDFISNGCYCIVTDYTNKKATVVGRYYDIMDPTAINMWTIPDQVTIDNGQGSKYTVTKIGQYASQNNGTNANVIQLTVQGKSITEIGSGAFQLPSLMIASIESAGTLGHEVFSGCSLLSTVALKSVATIGEYAFKDCVSLQTITIPANTTAIGTYAFRGALLLSAIQVDGDNTHFVSHNGWLYNKKMTQLLLCPPANTKDGWVATVKNISAGAFAATSRKKVYIPYGVTMINQGIFEGSAALEIVSIPSSVTNWAMTDAFKGCTALFLVSCNTKSVPTANESTFANSRANDAGLYVYSGLVDAYKKADYWKQFELITGRGYDILEDIGYYTVTSSTTAKLSCFGGTSDLDYTLPTTVRDIAGNTYTVTEIGDDAFAYRGLPRKMTAPSILKVGARAFADRDEMTAIDLPKVQTIGEAAFCNCSALQTVNLPVKMTAIGDACFQGCTSLKTIRWPLGVNTVGLRTFSGSGLTKFSAPYGLKKIGAAAFAGNQSLHDLLLPSTVTEISEYAFKDCERLVNIYVNAPTPPTISKYAFGETSSGLTLGIPVKSVAWLRVPKASVDTYKATEQWGGKNALFDKESITEGAYDFYVRAASGTDEHFDVKSWDESTNSGEVIWTGRRRDTSRFDVDCSTPREDEWGRQFAITEIADQAFSGDGTIGTFKLGTVKKVGKSAFRNAQFSGDIELTQADKGEVEIGTYAFADTKGAARVIIEGPASNGYQANITLGTCCFGEKPTAEIYVPKDQFSDFVPKVSWSPELALTNVTQLRVIYRPKNIIDNYTSENFPTNVSLRGTGLEGIIMTLDGFQIHKYKVSDVLGKTFVMLYTTEGATWQDRYLLKEPTSLPTIVGTPIDANPIEGPGTPRSASQEGYDVYVYVKEQNKYVKSTDDNPQDADKSYYVELPKGYDAVLVPLEEDLTGIRDVEATGRAADGRLYNLRGQRVDRPTKPGLYIINGKKVVIK